MQKVGAKINHASEAFFGNLGLRIARKPIVTIGLVLLVVIVSCAGFLNFTLESRPEKLWVPQDSLAITHKEYTEATFALGGRSSTFLAAAGDGGSMLRPEYIVRRARVPPLLLMSRLLFSTL
jgi:hypothetical protein